MIGRLKTAARLSIASLLGCAALAGTVQAQAADPARMEKRVDALEGQMKAVQRKVFPGGSPRYFEPDVAATPLEPQGTAPPAGGNPMGDLQSRVDALENQLATLTGQVEEATFKARQAEEALARLREDTEFRLQQLEVKTGLASANGLAPVPAAGAPAPAQTTPPATAPKPAATPAKPAAVAATPAAASRPAAAKPAPSPSRVAYEEAYAFVFEQKYDQAEPALLAFLNKYPTAPEASNAAFWLGRTYFNRKLYAQAAKSFLDGYRKYPRGEKGPDSLLGLGDAMTALGKPEEACQAYNELQAVYPSASASIKKRMADGRAKAKCAA